MISVDITVPSIGRQYNFSLEENIPVNTLIAEISELICQKECCPPAGDDNEFVLCSLDNNVILSGSDSLSRHGIVNGHRLMLV